MIISMAMFNSYVSLLEGDVGIWGYLEMGYSLIIS